MDATFSYFFNIPVRVQQNEEQNMHIICVCVPYCCISVILVLENDANIVQACYPYKPYKVLFLGKR